MEYLNIGFVGNGSDKFSGIGALRAKRLISEILEMHPVDHVVSGHSPVGGIDIWAEDYAIENEFKTLIFRPVIKQWNPVGGYGYKARNLDIARHSDILCVIVASEYPDTYISRKFPECYHCKSIGRPYTDHVKSGGCWTGKKCLEMGNKTEWFLIDNG